MSPTADSVVGMMDAAYFVGRKELLDFINDTLGLKLQKIEQTASGAVACQLFDIMFPNTIAMAKVNWAARSDYEFVQNYKILQGGFNKHHVQRYVDVDKLIRAKYQDNLEFMQWFKAFFEHSGGPVNLGGYQPREVRLRGKGGDKYNAQFGASGGGASTGKISGSRPFVSGTGVAAAASSSLRASAPAAEPKTATAPKPSSPRTNRPLRERPQQQQQQQQQQQKPSGASTGSVNAQANKAINNKQDETSTSMTTTVVVPDPAQAAKVADLEVQVQDMQQKVEDLEAEVLNAERERDFYFEKLRNVEVLLQVYQENEQQQQNLSVDGGNEDGGTSRPMPAEVVDKIFKVLYATPEEEVIVTNDGEVVPADQFLSHDGDLSRSVLEAL